jgi:hypothetical protein
MTGLLRSLLGGASPPDRYDATAWQSALSLPVFDGLTPAERERLQDQARQLLQEKTFSAAGGAVVDAYVCTAIAAFAALPVLNLGPGWYKGWREIIVYPGEFVPEREIVDEDGIVHHVRQPMSGEAWEGGPLVLSWQDVLWSGQGEGFNVVIHEFAHKLDMKNGGVNGQPPLHSGMSPAAWSQVWGDAYGDFCHRVDSGAETLIDPYAAESPAEFFAVLSEYFFEAPDLLVQSYPEVYEQLQQYYLQDPLSRMEPPDHDPANP